MAFWWPLLVLGLAFLICRFLLMLIPPNVPPIDVDASDVQDAGSQDKENSYIFIPSRGGVYQTDKVKCYEPATMNYLRCFLALTPDEGQSGGLVGAVQSKTWIWDKKGYPMFSTSTLWSVRIVANKKGAVDMNYDNWSL